MIEIARTAALRAGLQPAWLDRVGSDLGLLALHEWSAVSGHWAAVRERLAVARRARGVGELLRDQWDLWPETRARLRQDQQIRRDLGRRAWNSLRAA